MEQYKGEHIMPTSNRNSSSSAAQSSPLSQRIASAPCLHDDDNPLWAGPCADGPLGGITQTMLVRFLSCRERFRLKYILGLEPHDKWNHRIGYGNMWHVCEEALAKLHLEHDGNLEVLTEYTRDLLRQYPLQQEEITKWYNVCVVQFPEYVRYWHNHPDTPNRTPLMQEQVFNVPYRLPSGRTVRLRGKFDSVDLIGAYTDEQGTQWPKGVYLQENKTKGDIDQLQIERQLKFDLQTMLYLIALERSPQQTELTANPLDYQIRGVRYNVVRRPLSGGKGNISPHKERATKNTFKPAESDDAFYARLRDDYIAADPAYWFFRVRAEVSQRDIQVFRDTCLDPLLETVCVWYDMTAGDRGFCGYLPEMPPMNYRTPFGVYSALEENGATEYDAFLANGSEAGLRRTTTLFPELQ